MLSWRKITARDLRPVYLNFSSRSCCSSSSYVLYNSLPLPVPVNGNLICYDLFLPVISYHTVLPARTLTKELSVYIVA
ncbi:hypothetical protein PDIG_82620 [Penicillium digitatum PHI26]|uniref:Uncharacterized protein n=2 Tax=Penicillium digitatum TaxID=36651 RepID=K9FBX5_PEND2|nr:hypothetical protein PDIP_86420 [Penicillium digitatum Pd1]EKV04662.1 hypothetical protein PDIP_86420 [Penicillium digitatum Pd1]EKV05597.1 hypothetical protein PDIG_82620 [Penicillium digitatum PHI26]